MIQKECNEKDFIIQLKVSIENFVHQREELIQKWDLLAVEKRILSLLNQDVIPQIYQKVFEKSSDKLNDCLKEKQIGYDELVINLQKGAKIWGFLEIATITVMQS